MIHPLHDCIIDNRINHRFQISITTLQQQKYLIKFFYSMLPVEEVDDEGSVVDSGIPKNSERVYKHRCMTKGFQHIMLSINSIYSHCHSRSLPS